MRQAPIKFSTPDELESFNNKLKTALQLVFSVPEQYREKSISNLKAILETLPINFDFGIRFFKKEKDGKITIEISNDDHQDALKLEDLLIDIDQNFLKVAKRSNGSLYKILRDKEHLVWEKITMENQNPFSFYFLVRNQSGQTPFHAYAAYEMQSTKLSLLIKKAKHKSDLFLKTEEYGLNALHFAAQNQITDNVRILLSEGRFDPDSRSKSDSTPLHFVIFSEKRVIINLESQKNIISELLSRGANIDAVDKDKTSPLQSALKYKQQKIAQFLIEKGASVILEDKNRNDAISIAIRLHLQDTIEFIYQKFPTKIDWIKYAHISIQLENLEALRFFISQKMDVNAQDTLGNTLLHTAIGFGNIEIVNFLLAQKDINLDQRTDKNVAPLHLAIAHNNPDIFVALWKKKKDPSLLYGDKFTLLHIAAAKGHFEIVKYLLEAGLDPDANYLGILPVDVIGYTEDPLTDNLEKVKTILLANSRFKRLLPIIKNQFLKFEINLDKTGIYLKQYGVKTGLVIAVKIGGEIKSFTLGPNLNSEEEKEQISAFVANQKPQTRVTVLAPEAKTAEENIAEKTNSEINKYKNLIKIKLSEIRQNITFPISPSSFIKNQENIRELFANSGEIKDDNFKKYLKALEESFNSCKENEPESLIKFAQKFIFIESSLRNHLRSLKPKKHLRNKTSQENSEIIGQIELFFNQIHIMIANQQEWVLSQIENFSLTNPTLADLSQKFTQLCQIQPLLEYFSSPRKNIFATLASPAQPTYIPNITDEPKSLAQIFLPSNLTRYETNQLRQIQETIIGFEHSDEFLRLGAINLLRSQDIIDALIIARNFIDLLSEDKKEKFRNYLYENSEYYCNGNLDKACEFMVAAELFYEPIEDLSKIDKTTLVEAKKQDIQINEPESGQSGESSFAKKPKETLIYKTLKSLQQDNKFLIILQTTPHGKQLENPHIKNTPEELIKNNFICNSQDLKQILGIEIGQELIDQIVKTIANNFFGDIQKRSGGSHNIGFRIPKILPNKNSPLKDEEKEFYQDKLIEIGNQKGSYRT